MSITMTNRLVLFGEVIAVYRQSHAEHINTRCGKIRVAAGGKDNYHRILYGMKSSPSHACHVSLPFQFL